ncbi:hypothetical protein D3C86_1788300 [compost metagenome]
MKDSVGNRGRHSYSTYFSHSFYAEVVHKLIIFLNKQNFEIVNICMDRNMIFT